MPTDQDKGCLTGVPMEMMGGTPADDPTSDLGVLVQRAEDALARQQQLAAQDLTLEQAVRVVQEAGAESVASAVLRIQSREQERQQVEEMERVRRQGGSSAGQPNTTSTRALTDLERRFTYHPPTPDMVPVFQTIRETALLLAQLMEEQAPFSRELSLAHTKLEESVMWVNAAIARNGLRRR